MATCPHCGAAIPAGAEATACPACGGALHPDPEAERRAEQALSAPLTKSLIGINVAVFLAMYLAGVSPTDPNTAQLQHWGANFGPLTLAGQWWRLLSNVFVHIGILHLGLNMWALWNVGALAERLYGRWTYLYLYLFSGIAGSLASLAWHPQVTGAGASGAIFGVVGAVIVTLRWGKLTVPREVVSPILRSLVMFALYNLFYGAVKTGIDNSAHLGGLVGGLLLSAIVNAPALHRHGGERTRIQIALVLALALAGLAGGVERTRGWIVHAERAQVALQKNQFDAAISELRQVADRRPN